MARPTKEQEAVNIERDKKIVKMRENGYPFQYIANYFGLTKGRVYNIYKRNKNTSVVEIEELLTK